MNRREKPPKRRNRTVMGRRSVTPTTPVPRWKQAFSDCQLYEEGIPMATPPAAPSPSARKLAASLWELQDLPLPACLPSCLHSPNWIPYKSSPPGAALTDVNTSPFSQPDYIRSGTPSNCNSANHRHFKTGSLQRLLTRTTVEPGDDSPHAPTPTLVDRPRHIPYPLFATTGKGDYIDSETSTTSKELLKVFGQIRELEDQHNSSLSLTAALHAQLMQAHARVRELELPHRIVRREVEGLMSRFSEEKKSWKEKAEERVKAAVQPMKEELEENRFANQRLESTNQSLESANRRLTKELTEAQMATAKALQELESERQARQLMQEMCHELAQETGNDKAEVEELKRQSQQVLEALEEERHMLQLAEVWREERVQMKLGEARLALETKSAALDAMRAELESFLTCKRDERAYDINTFRDAQVLHNALSAVHYDTCISTFPPTSSLSSMSSSSSFPPTSEYMYAATLDTDSSQGSRNRGHAHLFYPEGIPDAD